MAAMLTYVLIKQRARQRRRVIEQSRFGDRYSLGPVFALSPDEDYKAAIAHLGTSAQLPSGLAKIVDKSGVPNMELVAKGALVATGNLLLGIQA
jgi:hypothetical protein